jgi:hypothetical protein
MSDEKSTPRHGCFFYGCVTMLVLLLLGGVGTYFGVKYAVNKIVNKYTDSKPLPLPRIEISDDQWKVLQDRVARFRTALDKREEPFTLELSAQDLNVLFDREPTLKDFKNRFHVAIESNKLTGTISVPLDNIGWSRLQGRYLNGTAALKVSLKDGKLEVHMDSLSVNGQAVPEEVMAGFREQNLASDVDKQPENRDAIQKFERVEIKDGKIIIQIKPLEKKDP